MVIEKSKEKSDKINGNLKKNDWPEKAKTFGRTRSSPFLECVDFKTIKLK